MLEKLLSVLSDAVERAYKNYKESMGEKDKDNVANRRLLFAL